jgi:hypothetical protein
MAPFVPSAVKTRFLRHEAWALQCAMRFPFFAIFILATLWPWFLVPALVLAPLFIFAIETCGVVGAILGLCMGAAGLLLVSLWVFPWCVLCVGLMLGRPRMAQVKADELEARLACNLG